MIRFLFADAYYQLAYTHLILTSSCRRSQCFILRFLWILFNHFVVLNEDQHSILVICDCCSIKNESVMEQILILLCVLAVCVRFDDMKDYLLLRSVFVCSCFFSLGIIFCFVSFHFVNCGDWFNFNAIQLFKMQSQLQLGYI